MRRPTETGAGYDVLWSGRDQHQFRRVIGGKSVEDCGLASCMIGRMLHPINLPMRIDRAPHEARIAGQLSPGADTKCRTNRGSIDG